MDPRNEPKAGWNLPAGVNDDEISRLYGSRDDDRCADCGHAVECLLSDGLTVLVCDLGCDAFGLVEVGPRDRACDEFYDVMAP